VATYEDGELTDFLPANCVVGRGKIEGRPAVVQGDDFTVRGGAADAAIWQKMVYARAARQRAADAARAAGWTATGGGGSVKSLEDMGHTYVPFIPGFELAVENLSAVPVVAAALGPVAGLGAARVGGGALLGDRPRQRPAVRSRAAGVAAAMGESPDKEELGGARAQTRARRGG